MVWIESRSFFAANFQTMVNRLKIVCSRRLSVGTGTFRFVAIAAGHSVSVLNLETRVA